MRPSSPSPHLRTIALLGGLAALAACRQDPAAVLPREPKAPVEVKASVDRAVATTGDLITYRIAVDYASDQEVEIPEPGAEIAGFRIIDVGREEPRQRGERLIEERWYELRADLVGSYVLPPITVLSRPLAEAATAEWQEASTSEIFVEVESVLPADGEAEDIRGLKPLVHVRRPLRWLWIGGGALAVAALAALSVWWLRRRRQRASALPVVPPHELAFAGLDALRGTDFGDPAAVRRFYFAISEVIRGYVEGRFAVNATDLTSEEIVAWIAETQQPAGPPRQELQSFLSDTDQVKFAHHEPVQQEIEATYERALSFVEATKDVPEEEPQEAAA